MEWERTVFNILLPVILGCSALIALTLPGYVEDSRLSEKETNLIEVLMTRDTSVSNTESRQPWVYEFTHAGNHYSGKQRWYNDHALKENEDGTAPASVRYLLTDPSVNRVEPVLTVGGISLVQVFPIALLVLILAGGGGWYVSCREHFEALRSKALDRSLADKHRKMIRLNLMAAPLLALLPAVSFALFFAVFHQDSLYKRHEAALGLATLCVWAGFLYLAKRGGQLEADIFNSEAER